MITIAMVELSRSQSSHRINAVILPLSPPSASTPSLRQRRPASVVLWPIAVLPVRARLRRSQLRQGLARMLAVPSRCNCSVISVSSRERHLGHDGPDGQPFHFTCSLAICLGRWDHREPTACHCTVGEQITAEVSLAQRCLMNIRIDLIDTARFSLTINR